MQTITVRRILDRYGLSASAVLASEKGYRNESHPVRLTDGQMVNLILYKHEPGILRTIRRVNDVSRHLAHASLPVRLPADGRIMRLGNGGVARYAAVYNYLSGETIAWEAYTQKHLKLLGRTMGELHAALRTYPGDYLPSVVQVYQRQLDRMCRYFGEVGIQLASRRKLGLAIPLASIMRYQMILTQCVTLSGQALHMDFVRSNVLFAPDEANEFGLRISGILDFEKVAFGHPVFDVARTLAFLLVDCKYKPEAKVRKYFLQSGYVKRGGGILPDARLLEELINLFLLYDLYKFLRHNPYEYLPQNEHFVRTRDFLLQRGVITTTIRA